MSRRLCLAVGLWALPQLAAAHAFGQSYDLPVPTWLYQFGAAAALLLSFLWLVVFMRVPADPRTGRQVFSARLPAARIGPGWIRVARLFALLALVLTVATGAFGTNSAARNFSMTWFWIWFVLGGVYLSALCGNIYPILNPWHSLFRLLTRWRPQWRQGLLHYPDWLGHYPAVGLYLALVGLELLGPATPRHLALMLLAYSLLSLLGASLYGPRDWFDRVELFGVVFGQFARLAPLRPEAQADGAVRIGLRETKLGLAEDHERTPGTVLFILCMLSTTAFDGLHESDPWLRFCLDWVHPALGGAAGDWRMALPHYQWIGLLLSPLLYLAVYAGTLRLARFVVPTALSTAQLACAFAPSLLPVALAYHLCHYATLMMSQGGQIWHQISDPFVWGWDLFGTAGHAAPWVPNPGQVWHAQVGVLLLGHVAGIVIAHRTALRVFPGGAGAGLSQLPMLGLMLGYTASGLWLLSLPIGQA